MIPRTKSPQPRPWLIMQYMLALYNMYDAVLESTCTCAFAFVSHLGMAKVEKCCRVPRIRKAKNQESTSA